MRRLLSDRWNKISLRENWDKPIMGGQVERNISGRTNAGESCGIRRESSKAVASDSASGIR